MPEDAGKKRYIKNFLQQIQGGEGFIEDIWIERVVSPPGVSGEGSIAKSMSGRQISNITELLEDDIRHSFDDGYFTFRFVAALLGSGKTSLLTYLHELTKNKPTYRELAIVIRFQLSDLLTIGGEQSFSIKLYCHILAQTFWELLHNKDLTSSVEDVAERILNDLLDKSPVNELKSAKSEIQFAPKFNKFLVESGVAFEDFFFHVLTEVSAVEPRFTFVYLTDELDSLQSFPNFIQETRALFKALIKRVRQKFKSRIHLLMYIVGTSDNVQGFIAGDSVLESIIQGSPINLSPGYNKEFEMIRSEIDKRIEGAYKGYKDFHKAWQEIKNIPLKPAKNLRIFCRDYASAVLEIHEKYFSEAPEQLFEGNARELLEAQCKQKWHSYLSKFTYKLSAVSTTTVLEGHAFDCYAELLHNEKVIARAFGEAKNYELLKSHLETFEKWLKDVDFKSVNSDGLPPDLAFLIAPECPVLLQRKLELKKITFIKADKVNVIKVISDDEHSKKIIDINTADKPTLTSIFKGTRVKQTTIDKLIKRRQTTKYQDLNELASDFNFSQDVKDKLEAKINNNEISFQ
ncbi:MAG: hypothetical protein HEQ19_21785 [Gloeotrichia echinulata CP02]